MATFVFIFKILSAIIPGYDPIYVKLWPLIIHGSFMPASEIKINGISNISDNILHIVVLPVPLGPFIRKLVP
jgi:hypothetical protein